MQPAFTVSTSQSGVVLPQFPTPQRLPDELIRRLSEDVWGSPIPYLRNWYDDAWRAHMPGGGFGGWGGQYQASGTVTDRKGGKNLPVFWSEIDLRSFRVLSRFLHDTNLFACGFIARLVDYHVRKGFSWQACRKGVKKTPYAGPDAEDGLITKAQSILDQFRDRQRWPLKSREAFKRWRRDGEVAVRFFRGRYYQLPAVRFVEPEQIGSPTGDTEGPESFGIMTDEHDSETIHAYFVRDADGDGMEGEWVDQSAIVFAKANVDSAVKRGIPDFFPVAEMLDGARRLLRNVIETSVTQAAVAWREKFPTATASQVQGLIPQFGMEKQFPQGGYPGTPGYPWGTNQVRGGPNMFPPGSVIRTEGNREYEDGPVAAGIPNYIEVEQAALRACGARWGMPEYFSGDASNNNFASSLVAGSPFCVAVEGTQLEWGVFERSCALKVLELAAQSGLLTQQDVAALDVEVEEPAVVNADPGMETDRRAKMHERGVLSTQTWQMHEGYDPQHEQANIDGERKRNADAGIAPDGSLIQDQDAGDSDGSDKGKDGSK